MNKYRNIKTICKYNHKHDSLKEAARCMELALLVRGGIIRSYRAQVPYDLVVNNKLICRHILDFEIIDKNNIVWVEDVKGVKTATWSIKHKLFKVLYPNIDYRII